MPPDWILELLQLHKDIWVCHFRSVSCSFWTPADGQLVFACIFAFILSNESISLHNWSVYLSCFIFLLRAFTHEEQESVFVVFVSSAIWQPKVHKKAECVSCKWMQTGYFFDHLNISLIIPRSSNTVRLSSDLSVWKGEQEFWQCFTSGFVLPVISLEQGTLE